jgi:hypothetical protein
MTLAKCGSYLPPIIECACARRRNWTTLRHRWHYYQLQLLADRVISLGCGTWSHKEIGRTAFLIDRR